MSWLSENFVWTSSGAPAGSEKISVLAMAETVFSVAAYWWIAWYFETYVHLLISVCVALLVLLRSPESAALGLEWIEKYEDQNDRISRRQTVIAGLCSACLTVTMVWVWTAGFTQIPHFLLVFVLPFMPVTLFNSVIAFFNLKAMLKLQRISG